jgi:iron(III) transport system permease protein
MAPPRGLTIAASIVALAMLLPLAYLVVRGLGAGDEGARFIFSERGLVLLWQTLVLASVVTVLCALLGVPLAWLTTRTDLPWRRFW